MSLRLLIKYIIIIAMITVKIEDYHLKQRENESSIYFSGFSHDKGFVSSLSSIQVGDSILRNQTYSSYIMFIIIVAVVYIILIIQYFTNPGPLK
jgi:hypothetical protein